MVDLLKELEAVANEINQIAALAASGLDRRLMGLTSKLRTHHAEIAEALADARRWRAARDCVGDVGVYEGLASRDSGVSLLLGDEADAAIDAQHNSAREG
jgi:aryl carrier-like protein